MKIKFKKLENMYYEAQDHYGCALLYRLRVNALLQLMLEFESFVYSGTCNDANNNYSTFTFRFAEEADEAAFLLWSNEGIEI